MKQYRDLDEFIADLPVLTAGLTDKLRGRDNLFCLQTERRTVYVQLRDGRVTLPQAPSETPVCTVTAAEDKLMGLLAGRENAMKLLLFGGVKVKGDVKPLLNLARLL